MRDFVSLHNHTSLGSMQDALISVDALFDKAKEFNHKAVAVTDHGTLTAFYDAFQAYKRTGVKFIPGCEMYFVHTYEPLKGKIKRFEKAKHMVLLAKNEIGYKNLLKINYIGFEHGVVSVGKMFSRVSWDIIREHSEGIICTSACMNGILSKLILTDQHEEAEWCAIALNNIFKDGFYIEIQPHELDGGEETQDYLNEELIKIAKKFNIPLIVGIDVHYATKEEEKYHDMLIAIKQKRPVDDPDRFKYGIDEFFYKNGDEIYDFLSEHYGEEIAAEAIENTVKIADMCEEPDYMEIKGNHLPVFKPKIEPDYEEFIQWREKAKLQHLKEDAAFMRFKIYKGFKKRYKDLTKDQIKERLLRIKKELKVLEGNNFSSYMLIVSDFVKWAKNNGILVGPGRGSSLGCIIAYLLEINDADPLEYGLLFERFQNAYKSDLPDIDIDFTSAGRDKVQEYCRKKYGIDHCAQISNINTYTPKNVIPNLVKSMRNVMPNLIPTGENYVKISNAIKDVIPDQDGDGNKVKTLKRAIELSKPLQEFAEKCPELMEYADALVGLPKEYATHAAGLCIADIPIVEFAPLRVDKNGVVAVQYEKNRCESVGLIKMDFLAISTLDMIDSTLQSIKKAGINGPEKMEYIPLNDEETYKMIQNGNTRCVFQLGTSGMMVSLCKQIKPDNIEDIATINALGRPSSSNEERTEYINRRFGKSEVTFVHSSLENSTKNTYGFGVFEEQLMGVAQDVAGWDLNKADGLRKLTKLKGKNPKLAMQLEKDFIDGFMEKHSVSYEEGKNFWDTVIARFSLYGFNKSHAVAYSINGYITAYLKCHYPAAYLASYLNMKTAKGGINKDAEIDMAKSEARRIGIKILPPDINNSTQGYEILDKDNIIMGLAAVKGLGPKVVDEVVGNQPYESFIDFIRKTSGRVINISKIKALAKAGCFDSMDITRKNVFRYGKPIREKLNAWVKKNLDGSASDGYNAFRINEEFSVDLPDEEWNMQEKLRYEQEVLGELVTGTLKDMFPNFFQDQYSFHSSRIKKITTNEKILVEFLPLEVLREFKIKKGKNRGKNMRVYRINDIGGSEMELTIWPDCIKLADRLLSLERPVQAICRVNRYNGQVGLVLSSVEKVYGM